MLRGLYRCVKINGQTHWEPCLHVTQEAVATNLDTLAAEGKASLMLPPPVTIDMVHKVLQKARPSISQEELQMYEDL